MTKSILIDGTNLAFRNFYAIEKLCRSDGLCTNAIFGWIKSLWRIQDSFPDAQFFVFFDISRSQYRKELYPEYKATRSATPDELKQQFPYIKEISDYLGFCVQEQQGVEADDLIASFAKQASDNNQEAIIVSSDKDFAQCVNENVSLLNAGSWTLLNSAGVFEKFEVYPNQIIDFLSLIGDSVDNIPGIPGVGPKTAAKWLQSHQSIETILNSIDTFSLRWISLLNENKDLLLRNQKLIRLQNNCNINASFLSNIQVPEILQFLNKMELKSLVTIAQKRFSIAPESSQSVLPTQLLLL